MNNAASAFVDFWTSHWWQLYVGALLVGFVSSVGIARWSRDTQWENRYGLLIRLLLFSGAGSMLLAITLTFAQLHDSPWESFCFLYDHHLGFFVDGSVLPLIIMSLFVGGTRSVNQGALWNVWLNRRAIDATRFWVALFYMACGLNKFLTRETFDFFHSSGYSTGFFYFIASWELGWGLELAWQRAWFPAISALSCDMAGAIYTHYHNYFSRAFPGPFENSLDALRMLFLMGYLALALTRASRESGTNGKYKLSQIGW